MPPRPRREAPDRRDARIHKHLQIAAEYWGKCPRHLAEGDLQQAGEKGGGTVAHLTKALAILRGWEHYDHVAVWEAVQAVADEMPDAGTAEPVRRGLAAATSLYAHCYDGHLEQNHTAFILETIAPMLDVLWERIPAEYTAGVSFAQWVEHFGARPINLEVTMPPRTRREAPDRRDARIHKHLEIAADYWAKCPLYLDAGDLRQAGEKGWGTVAQLTKVVATLRGWEHFDHVAIKEAVLAVAAEMPDAAATQQVRNGFNAAESLHGNFYESHLDQDHIAFNLTAITELLDTLWEQIPANYTGGASFAEWVDAAASPGNQ